VAGQQDGDLSPYVRTCLSNQLRVDGRIVDGELEETMTYEPLDERQADIFTRFAGATYPLPPRRFVPVGRDLFAPAGVRMPALSGTPGTCWFPTHNVAASGATYRCAGGTDPHLAGEADKHDHHQSARPVRRRHGQKRFGTTHQRGLLDEPPRPPTSIAACRNGPTRSATPAYV
jgi:hypothetical protein